MAAKYSPFNRMGFRHKFLTRTYLAIFLAFLWSIIIPAAFSEPLYSLYVSTKDVQPGSVGSMAYDTLPFAHSFAEMQQLDRFTIQIDDEDWRWQDNRFYLDDKPYYIVPLPSGENMAVRLNIDSILTYEDPYVRILPVGTLRELKFEKDNGGGHLAIVADRGYYVDMIGDFATLYTQDAFSDRVQEISFGILIILLIPLVRVTNVRKGKFAPAFFPMRDPMLPKNDLELWCASIYAIWSYSFTSLEGWPLMGGSHRSHAQLQASRSGLTEQWDIDSAESGLKTVHSLTNYHIRDASDPDAGWDLCRATQLLGMMYKCRMIDRKTMDEEYSRVAVVIQRDFPSWEALTDNYLEGYARWIHRVAEPGEAEQRIEKRQRILEHLRRQENGPYAIPWNIDLRWSPHDTPSTTWVKTILPRIHVD